MIKKLLAAAFAAALIFTCLPFAAGCSAAVEYHLVEDEGGDYYEAACSGFAAAMTGEVEIEAQVDGIPVKRIAEKGFSGAGITKIIIPETVESVGVAAFAYCPYLTGVEFAEGSALEKIERGAFGYCTALREIALPSSLTEIGGMAFYECGSLTSVQLPSSLNFLGDRAFCLCDGLTEITLPANLKIVDYRAFYQCTGLESVTLNQGLERVGVEAFSLCTNLKEIIVPSSVRDGEYVDGDGKTQIEAGVGYAAFQGCQKLERAVILADVAAVKSATFGHCPALREVWLPKSVKSVEGGYLIDGKVVFGHAFYGNPSLTDIYFAGTEGEWSGVKIDTSSFSDGGVLSDNRALIDAAKHYGAVFGGNK